MTGDGDRVRGMKNLDDVKVVGIINPAEDPTPGGRSPMPQPEADSARNADAAYVRGLRSDNPDTLRHLMETYWAPLVGFAHRILPETGEAEDMVQTAFVRLWSRRRALKDTGSLRSLLYTIVRNACLDELRTRHRRNEAQESSSPPHSPRTPYEDVQGAELQRLAAAAVSRLPERRREVFRLVREEGLSYHEVAEILGLSTQTVANHMSLAMADLRTALKPHLSDRANPKQNTGDAGLDREQMDG
jgi:RNA polymerase sigma-70 factor (ECF subfamily)